MKIVVAGGRNKADFLIGSLLEKQHEVIIINDEESYCVYLTEKYNIPIITGNPCKRYILEEDVEKRQEQKSRLYLYPSATLYEGIYRWK